MKPFRRMIQFAIAAVLAAGLAACAAALSPEPTAAPTPEAEPSAAADAIPSPSPAPEARYTIINIPSEAEAAAMGIERIEDTPFFRQIADADDVVLAEFWSSACGACAEVKKTLAEVSAKEKVTVLRVNVETNPVLADQMGLVVLPSVYVFLDGEQVDAVLGAAPADDYAAVVEKYRKTPDE